MKKLFFPLVASAFTLGALAAQPIQQSYDTSATEWIPNTITKLSLQIAAQCHETPEAAERAVRALADRLNDFVTESSEFSFDQVVNNELEIQVSPAPKWTADYLNPRDLNALQQTYTNRCSGETSSDLNVIDEEAKTYYASASLELVNSEEILRREIKTLAREINEKFALEEDKRLNEPTLAEKQAGAVGYASTLDSPTPEAFKAAQAKVQGSSKISKLPLSRLTVDSLVHGFNPNDRKVAPIETIQRGGPTYESVQIKEVDGKAVLTANFRFNVRLGNPLGGTFEGVKTFQVAGSAERAKADYYQTYVTISTSCHDTREAASEAVQDDYDYFENLIGKGLKAGSPLTDRKEDPDAGNANSLTDSDALQPWTWEKYDTGRVSLDNKPIFAKRVVKYRNKCTGAVVDAKVDADGRYSAPVIYMNAQRIKLHISSFKALKKIQKEAQEVTAENVANDGVKAVRVTVDAPNARLTDENHRVAVEYDAYKNAIQNMLKADSPVAEYLAEVEATEAYYQFLGYNTVTTYANPDFDFGPRAQSGRSAGLESASSPKSFAALASSAGTASSVPYTKVQESKVYTIHYEPKNLVDLIGSDPFASDLEIDAP